MKMKAHFGIKMASFLKSLIRKIGTSRRRAMSEYIPMQDFCQCLFDNDKQAGQAALIYQAILEVRSPRLSNLSHRMPANPDANYRRIQRFLATGKPQTSLQRLFWEEAKFIIGDPMEIERRRARHTDYVRVLKDARNPWFLAASAGCPFPRSSDPVQFCILLLRDYQ
jgi:hypothetical protein